MFPLYSQSLNDLLTKAEAESESVKMLNISKENSLLINEKSNLSRSKYYTINPSINVTVNDWNSNDVTYKVGSETSSLLNIVFPGDKKQGSTKPIYNDTTLSLGMGTTINNKDSGLTYTLNPSIGLKHKFLFGEYNNLEDDISNQSELITINQTYLSRLISYKIVVLNKIKDIVKNSKDIENYENLIRIDESNIKNNLDLQLYNKDTVAYKAAMLTLEGKKKSLENENKKGLELKKDFEKLTGFPYEEIDEISIPTLELPSSDKESLTVQLARLKLQSIQNKIDENEKSKDQSHLNLSGSDIPMIVDSNLKSNIISINCDYIADSYNLSSSLSLSSDFEKGTHNPSFSISGSWSSNSTKEEDIIINKTNSNELILAQNEFNTTLSDYSFKKMKLKTDIDTWKFNYSQLKSSIRIAKENYSLLQQMFDLGLKTQSELDKSKLEIDQLKYDETSSLLSGRIYELDIENLSL